MKKKPHGAAVPMIAVDRKSEKPLHRQIYDAFRAMILERRLQPGQQIPSTRALADELGISRIPVLGAYAQLLAEGYIESRSGAGTFVTSSLSDQFLSARPAVASVANDPRVRRHFTRLQASAGGRNAVVPGFGRFQRRADRCTIIFRFASGPTW